MSATHIPAALRRLVRDRARERCEYCLIPESITLATHAIDHIVAEKHGGPTVADNLALSCTICNGYKGSDLASVDPESGVIVPLFHPRRDCWLDHFLMVGGRLEPRTATGRVTVRLLQLNHPDRVAERTLLAAAGVISMPSETVRECCHVAPLPPIGTFTAFLDFLLGWGTKRDLSLRGIVEVAL